MNRLNLEDELKHIPKGFKEWIAQKVYEIKNYQAKQEEDYHVKIMIDLDKKERYSNN